MTQSQYTRVLLPVDSDAPPAEPVQAGVPAHGGSNPILSREYHNLCKLQRQLITSDVCSANLSLLTPPPVPQIQYKRVFLRMVKILTLTTNDDLEDFPEEEREAGADM